MSNTENKQPNITTILSTEQTVINLIKDDKEYAKYILNQALVFFLNNKTDGMMIYLSQLIEGLMGYEYLSSALHLPLAHTEKLLNNKDPKDLITISSVFNEIKNHLYDKNSIGEKLTLNTGEILNADGKTENFLGNKFVNGEIVIEDSDKEDLFKALRELNKIYKYIFKGADIKKIRIENSSILNVNFFSKNCLWGSLKYPFDDMIAVLKNKSVYTLTLINELKKTHFEAKDIDESIINIFSNRSMPKSFNEFLPIQRCDDKKQIIHDCLCFYELVNNFLNILPTSKLNLPKFNTPKFSFNTKPEKRFIIELEAINIWMFDLCKSIEQRRNELENIFTNFRISKEEIISKYELIKESAVNS